MAIRLGDRLPGNVVGQGNLGVVPTSLFSEPVGKRPCPSEIKVIIIERLLVCTLGLVHERTVGDKGGQVGRSYPWEIPLAFCHGVQEVAQACEISLVANVLGDGASDRSHDGFKGSVAIIMGIGVVGDFHHICHQTKERGDRFHPRI